MTVTLAAINAEKFTIDDKYKLKGEAAISRKSDKMIGSLVVCNLM